MLEFDFWTQQSRCWIIGMKKMHGSLNLNKENRDLSSWRYKFGEVTDTFCVDFTSALVDWAAAAWSNSQ